MSTFALYSPKRKMYVGDTSNWEAWPQQAKEFPSQAEAELYIEQMGWVNSTSADSYRNLYVVKLTRID